MKAFKDGNKLYASERFSRRGRSSTRRPSRPIRAGELNSCGTSPGCVYFYLANSYDNLYRPARKGEPNNDAYLTRRSPTTSWLREKISDPR